MSQKRFRTKKDHKRWLLEASQILEPEKDWPRGSIFYAYACSPKTWKRFLLPFDPDRP